MTPNEKDQLSSIQAEISAFVTLCHLMVPHFHTEAATPEQAADVLRIIKLIGLSVYDAIEDLTDAGRTKPDPIKSGAVQP